MIHNIRLFLFSLFLLIICSSNLSAQWKPTSGPFMGSCYCLAGNGQNLFVSAPDGLYLSTNNGTSWSPVNFGIPNQSISAIAIFDNDIFAGANNNLLFHSTDNGITWTNLTFLSVPYYGTMGFSSFARIGSTLFMGTYRDGVYISTDNGASWQNVYRGFLSAMSLTSVGTNLFACNVLGVFMSTDYGVSWSYANSGLTNTSVYSLAAAPGDSGRTNLYAGTSAGSIFVSTNNGSYWNPVGAAIPDEVISLAVDHSNNGTIIYAGTRNTGVFRNVNNASKWTKISTGLTSANINSLLINGPYLFASMSVDGVNRSSDNGSHWEIADAGFTPNAYVNAFASNGSTILISTGNAVYYSTNNGILWSRSFYGLQINALAFKDNYLYAGTYGNDVIFSSDNGFNWKAPATSFGDAIYTISVNGNNLYAGGNYGAYTSTDNGVFWTQSGRDVMTAPCSFAFIGSDIYSAARQGVFRSTNNGLNWTSANYGLPNGINCIVAYGNNLFAGTANDGIYLSTNFGASWNYAVSGIPYGTSITALTVSGTSIFAGTLYGKAYCSTNIGSSWTDVSSGLVPNVTVTSFFVNGTDLLCGTWSRGVWSRPLSELTAVNGSDNQLPKSFSLEQNYPNPFNPNTTIEFSLPHSAHVSLSIYNSMGQEVAQLLSQNMSAGIHSTQWNASQFASGVYYYRLTAGNFLQTKKLLLLK